MNNHNPSFSWAAKWMLMCSVLQVTSPLIVGLHTASYLMFGLGLLGWLTAYGLYQGWRWLAYLAYIPVMAVMIWAFAQSFDVFGLAKIWYLGIAVLDGLVMLCLFKALWQKPYIN